MKKSNDPSENELTEINRTRYAQLLRIEISSKELYETIEKFVNHGLLDLNAEESAAHVIATKLDNLKKALLSS